MTRCILIWLCLMFAGPAPAAEGPIEVPPALSDELAAAQRELRNGQVRDAIKRLNAYAGEDHALRHALLGQALVKLPDEEAAIKAFRRALAMDDSLKAAGLGLAQLRARREEWQRAAELLGQHIDTDTCDADELLLYAQVARQMDDARLCGLLTRKGVMRFPTDTRFRRLDLALLVNEGDHAGARRVVRWLLDKTPGNADLWLQLAGMTTGADDEAERSAAIEAAVLCDPADPERRRGLLAAWLNRGDWPSVVRAGRKLLSDPNAPAPEPELVDLLIRAADMGEKDDLLAKWLALVPDERRTRAMRVATARLALRSGDTDDARRELGKLIEAGETDPAVFLWAGHLAETAGDTPEAETLYEQARRAGGSHGRLAVLYLARLMLRTKRHAEAARLLNGYLDAHPEDAAARALLALTRSRE